MLPPDPHPLKPNTGYKLGVLPVSWGKMPDNQPYFPGLHVPAAIMAEWGAVLCTARLSRSPLEETPVVQDGP